MVELKFVEDCENQIITCSTPKRKVDIKIFLPVGQFPHWKITYSDGKPIEGLSEGVFLSRRDAKNAVIFWERDAVKTKEAKQYELFGDKQPPVLKRKKVASGPRA